MNLIYSNRRKNAAEKSNGLYYDNFSTYDIGDLEFGAWRSDIFEGNCVNLCKAPNANKPKFIGTTKGQHLTSGGIPGGIVGGISDFSINAFPLDLRTRKYWRKIRLGFHVSLNSATHVQPAEFGFGFLNFFDENIPPLNEVEWNYKGFFQKTNTFNTAGLVVANPTSDIDAMARTTGQPWGSIDMTHKLTSDVETFVQSATVALYPIGITGYTAFHIYVEVDRGLDPDVYNIFLGTSSSARGKTEAQFKERLQLAYGGLSGTFADESGGPITGHSYKTFAAQGELNFMSHFGMISNGQGLTLDAVGYQVLEEFPTPINLETGESESSDPVPDGDGSSVVIGQDVAHFKFVSAYKNIFSRSSAYIRYRNIGEDNFSILQCKAYLDGQLEYESVGYYGSIPSGSEVILVPNLTPLELENIEELRIAEFDNYNCKYANINGMTSLKFLSGTLLSNSSVIVGNANSTIEYILFKNYWQLGWRFYKGDWWRKSYTGITIDGFNMPSLKFLRINGRKDIDYDLSSCVSLEKVIIDNGKSITAPNSVNECEIQFRSENFEFADFSALTNATSIKVEGNCSGNIDIPNSPTLKKISVFAGYLNLNYDISQLPSLSEFLLFTSSELSIDVSGLTNVRVLEVGHHSTSTNPVTKPVILPLGNSNLEKLVLLRSDQVHDLSIYPSLVDFAENYCNYSTIDLTGLSLVNLEVYDTSVTSVTLCSTLEKFYFRGPRLSPVSIDASMAASLKRVWVYGTYISSISLGISDSVENPFFMLVRSVRDKALIKSLTEYFAGLKVMNGRFSVSLSSDDGQATEIFWNPVVSRYASYDSEIYEYVKTMVLGRLWNVGVGSWGGRGADFRLPFPYHNYDPLTRVYNALEVRYDYDPLP